MAPPLRLFLVAGAVVVAAVWKLLRKDDQKESPKGDDARPRAFISFDFDHDLREKHLFAGQCKTTSPTPFAAEDWSSKDALPQHEWERLIREKIGRCHFMFVLVSPSAHTATGIIKEIEMATEQRVPIVGVYVRSATKRTKLPTGLRREDVVAWEWAAIAGAIERALKEGKNAR